ncbi:MAG TPA: Mur ligase domain-containing protein, partial [Ktedonobacterales bacterium]
MQEPSLEELFPHGISGKRIHAMGAGGSGISAVVRLAREAGATVTGCDRDESTMLRILRDQGFAMAEGHDAAHVRDADLVVTTSAITFPYPDHPELLAAHEAGIPVALWQRLMGYLMRERTGVSVAGVHGKGTTTGMLGALAVAAGLDPTVELGAVMVDWGSNIHLGSGSLFIHEADEFNYQFMSYHPRVLVLTAVEYDHPEFFRDYAHIRDAFVGFAKGMAMAPGVSSVPPTLVLNADNPGCMDVL